MYSAVIVCGGKGERTGLPYNKVLYEINGKPLVGYVVDSFKADTDCEEIILVAPLDELDKMRKLFFDSVDCFVSGGTFRQESVLNGIQEAKSEYVMIHDGSRPYLPKPLLQSVKKALIINGAVTCAIPIVDTLKRVEDTRIVSDIDRLDVYAIQTPQAFRRNIIVNAHLAAIEQQKTYTCDASLVKDLLHQDVYIVKGDRANIKFTAMEDLAILKAVLS